MRLRLKRVLGGAAAIGLAATVLVPLVATAADAAPGLEFYPTISPSPTTAATTAFSFTVPGNVVCAGTGAANWRANSFIVNESRDVSTLDFSVSGLPAGYVGVDFNASDGTIAAPLHKGEDAGVNFLPATSPAGLVAPGSLAGFNFDPTVWTLVDGRYKVGFACVDGPGKVRQSWTRVVTIDVGNVLPAPFMTVDPDLSPGVTPIGSCSNMKGLGSLKSTSIALDGKPFGITDQNDKDVAISLKGVDPLVAKPPAGTANVGSCTYLAGLSTPNGDKPVVPGYNGTKVIDKWSAKLFSPEADCNSADDATDLTEWPLNGAFGFTYRTDARKQSVTFTVQDFTSDVMAFNGIVVKGVAAGADVSGSLYFDPAVKDSAQTTATPYFGYSLDVSGACADPLAAADVRSVLVGDGRSALNLQTSGINFSIAKG